jgi:hypothetical protein
MTCWTPVLYFEETTSSSGSDGTSSSQDWQFCVVYDGFDTYNLYGNRNSTNQTWDMTFLSRQSLTKFLLSTLSSSSVVKTSLYVVDEDSLHRDNFQNYYCAWDHNNELYSQENSWSEVSFRQVMDHLHVLRDARVN